jgi:hypothetical protein
MVTTEFNENSEGTFGNRSGEKEVGGNCTLSYPDGVSVPVENVSFSEEANTSEVQYTDSFSQSIAVTGVSYSGSFDIPGNANDERDSGWDKGQNNDSTTLPNYVENLTITDGEGRVYTFQNVLLNSHSKDIPSDDRTSQSFDFMAEKLTI